MTAFGELGLQVIRESPTDADITAFKDSPNLVRVACVGLPRMIKALRAAAPPRVRPDADVPRDGHSHSHASRPSRWPLTLTRIASLEMAAHTRTHRVPELRWVP